MYLLRKGRSACFCQQDTLCNCEGLPTSTTTVKNANHTVGTHKSMFKPSPPWLHCHGTPPRTGNDMPNVSAEPLQLQKQRFITGEVLSEAGRSQRKGFSFNRPSVLVHVAPYEHTVVRQRDPLRQVSLPHSRWATVTVFRGAANDPDNFSTFAEVCTPAPPPYLVN